LHTYIRPFNEQSDLFARALMIFALCLLIALTSNDAQRVIRYLQSRFYHFHISYYLQNWGKSLSPS
jgi:hypothetical protein